MNGTLHREFRLRTRRTKVRVVSPIHHREGAGAADWAVRRRRVTATCSDRIRFLLRYPANVQRSPAAALDHASGRLVQRVLGLVVARLRLLMLSPDRFVRS
jgi:hypothetical protein